MPSIVPNSAQNTTALVLRDEMVNRLSKLKTMADWASMIEELSASKGDPLPRVVCALAEVVLETKRRTAIVLSPFTGSSLPLMSLRN